MGWLGWAGLGAQAHRPSVSFRPLGGDQLIQQFRRGSGHVLSRKLTTSKSSPRQPPPSTAWHSPCPQYTLRAPATFRRLQLEDVDLGDRRITIAGHVRRLDDLSLKVIKEYLAHRKARWPSTANPHLLVSGRTIYDTRPVTSYYINHLFRGHKATLDRPRVDRWLEEALDRGPDPLHLAAVFGISTANAIRYAQAALHILEDDATPP